MHALIIKAVVKIFFALVVLLTASIPANADTKKRIAILDFTANNTEKSNATIVRNAFEVSLYKTGVFDILERNQIELILKEQGLQMSGCADTSCAVQIGRMLSADYVITGSLDRFQNFIISIKLVSIKEGKVIYADNKNALQENEIQKQVISLADDIAGWIEGGEKYVKRNKPQKQRPIFGDSRLWISAGFIYSYPLGEFSDLVKSGYGGSFELGIENLLLKNLMCGIETGYWYSSGKTKNTENLMMIPIFLTLRYNINIFNFLYIAPQASLGMTCNRLSYDKDGIDYNEKPEYSKKTQWELIAKGGLHVGYPIGNNLEVYISSYYGVVFEKDGRMNFIINNAGVGLRF